VTAEYVAHLGELLLEHLLRQLAHGQDQLLGCIVLTYDRARQRGAPRVPGTEKAPADVRFATQPIGKLGAAAVDELDVDDGDGEGAQPHTLSRFCARECQGHVEPSPLEREMYRVGGSAVHDD
jgi:hypothetical protein